MSKKHKIEVKPTIVAKPYIVRVFSKETNPMVGEILGINKAGTLCWDMDGREYSQNTVVLVNKTNYNIIDRIS